MAEINNDGNITLTLSGYRIEPPPIPAAFLRTTGAVRGGDRDPKEDKAREMEEDFLPDKYFEVKAAYDIAPVARDFSGAFTVDITGTATSAQPLQAGPGDIFVFELSDGGTFIANPKRLREALDRSKAIDTPQSGLTDIDRLVAGTTTQRGITSILKGMISRVSLLHVADLPTDRIFNEVADKLGKLEAGVTWLGTKALMAAIESRLERRPGLYRLTNYSGQGIDLVEARLTRRQLEASEPTNGILVFVHGTGSNTLGSFGHLCTAEPDLWKSLVKRFGEHIYGFEHRTLSESPIDNALALAEAIPEGTRVSFVTHSRGGLVVDLLCLADFHSQIDHYAYQFPRLGTDDRERYDVLRTSLADAHAEQRERLADLASLLQRRKFKIHRYARIASPANGTLLASGNFDVFLSSLLTLLLAVPFLYSSSLYWAFRRVVIEVAKRRTDPHMVPGIEAMLPDSPLAQLLCDARVQPGIQMAIIAGDSEGGDMLSRLRVALTDFVLFDKQDNDLVVDTPAMLAGIAPQAGARVLFERGSDVSHFRYFANSGSRGALRDWLLSDDPNALPRFVALPDRDQYAETIAASVKERRGLKDDRLPVVVVLPDLMGSHLNSKDGRLWYPLATSPDALDRLNLSSVGVEAKEIFDVSYGNLCTALSDSHNVFPFAYDWRQSLETLGASLARFLEAFRKGEQPVRLLAHGMGGLVVRACAYVTRDMAAVTKSAGGDPPILELLMRRKGSRFIMLGTPNHGTHAIVADLMGKGDGFRALWRLDIKGPKFADLLATFSTFPGVLSLLPTQDFIDASQTRNDDSRGDYHKVETWRDMARHLHDRWFGSPGSIPDEHLLRKAAWLFEKEFAAGRRGDAPLPSGLETKTVYVFGVAPSTPCGVERPESEPERTALLATPSGDGVVTWESGRLAGIDSYYFMPERHGDLLAAKEYFPAILELLKTGATRRLPREAPARAGDTAGPIRYDAPPPTASDPEAVQRCLLGGSVRRRLLPGKPRRLAVEVRSMDLRFFSRPIMVGHYEQDPIAGPEALIDRELLGGDLSKRYNLGQYAGAPGSATVVLRGASACTQRGRLTGAIVTGLGRYDGSLSASELTESVRVGALRFLLQVVDVLGKEDRELELGTLLLGYNSSANLTASSSVEALVRGVLLANARFHDTTGLNIHIANLDIVEMYLDTAVSAAYALRALGDRLKLFADQHDSELEIAKELVSGEGARQRYHDTDDASYWPRIIVTNADQEDGVLTRHAATGAGAANAANGFSAGAGSSAANGKQGAARIADRLRFMFIGTRARAETTVQQRQPNLIEMLVRQQIAGHDWNPEFSRMLFQLMVPHDFKDAARQLDRLVLVVDDLTANLPWELMLAEGPPAGGEQSQREGTPLAVRTSVVRQLATTRYRPQVVHAAENTALIIGNPSVHGFCEAFVNGAMQCKKPAPLPGARAEALAIVDVLGNHSYTVKSCIGELKQEAASTGESVRGTRTWRLEPGHAEDGKDPAGASEVLAALYSQPWRILHVAGHGVFQMHYGDGIMRSGVLLSDGLLITAAEIAAMEVVPELVFLNCCHSGQIDEHNSNRLAASVASELIGIGVRCVLVAGWAVDDELARVFGTCFYNELLGGRRQFGEAVFEARNAVWRKGKNDLTWGAFQAYGDPGWMAGAASEDVIGHSTPSEFVAIEELLDALTDARIRLAHQRDAFAEHDGAVMLNRVNELVENRGQPNWSTRPELHSALGATMRELNQVKRAYDEFLCAVQLEDPYGRVPIHDIEQLADVEAEYGEQCCEQALTPENGDSVDTALLQNGERLIKGALARLECLNKLTMSGPVVEPSGRGLQMPCPLSTAPNCVRLALRGKVCRRMASVQARRILSSRDENMALAHKRILKYLELAAAAYRKAEGSPSLGYFFPDLALSRLTLEALAGEYAKKSVGGDDPERKREPAVALARLCAQSSDNSASDDSTSSLLRARAMLVEELIGGGFGAEDHLGGRAIFESIAQAYLDATTFITLKPSELDTLVTDIESQSRLFLALARLEEKTPAVRKRIADRLRELARQLQPRRTSLAEKRNLIGLPASGKAEVSKTI